MFNRCLYDTDYGEQLDYHPVFLFRPPHVCAVSWRGKTTIRPKCHQGFPALWASTEARYSWAMRLSGSSFSASWKHAIASSSRLKRTNTTPRLMWLVTWRGLILSMVANSRAASSG